MNLLQHGNFPIYSIP